MFIGNKTPGDQFMHQSKLCFSSLYNCSTVKLPMEPWPILSPMTPPPPIMLQMPSNLIKTPAYFVQDPMPAILGLAPYQSWKPNVRNQISKIFRQVLCVFVSLRLVIANFFLEQRFYTVQWIPYRLEYSPNLE